MNGRIYDPLLGRFLSGDILVQFPGDLQSYNRYSYVRNNPLTLTDPTGFLEAGKVDPRYVDKVPTKAVKTLADIFKKNPLLAIALVPFFISGDQWHPAPQNPQIIPQSPEQPDQQEAPKDPGKPVSPTPNEVKIDPNTIQANQGDQVKTNQSPPAETKPDAPKEEPKKDDAGKDDQSNTTKEGEKAKDDMGGKDAASKAASGKLRPMDGRDVKASDMHVFKQSILGKDAPISKYDAKVDENGQVVLVTKDGKTKVETGSTPSQVREEYPTDKDKDKEKKR